MVSLPYLKVEILIIKQEYIMKMKVEFKDRQGNVAIHSVSCSYLQKFVKTNKKYPVDYTILQDGTRVEKPTMLLGRDLTEPQITKLFLKELL